MPKKDSIIVLDAGDPRLTAKAKELNKKGWRFSEKKDDKIYYKQYKNPLFAVDRSHLIVFLFVAAFAAILVIGLVVF
ncbi:MAG: hypothetical protein KAJ88_02700 [Candidatus Aenigmarchaeota archaeon]|nr:hypothetical protein [Candidatus Aenigmarchaeota archaeon]